MKKPIIIIITLLMLAVGISAAEGKSYKVLTIGASYSVDALIHQYRLVKELGAEDVVIGSLYIGGCTLSMHYENMKLNKASYTYYKYDNSPSLQTIRETSMLDVIKECSWLIKKQTTHNTYKDSRPRYSV